ncbi:MAG: 3-isopropylmalate dehydratase small subunit [Candidatus Melainabacteria bacterium]|jgi:3-isopropylmalate dehydratase small subunit|nr:3-isopropylmalate dehydratase small subunit [Candidatus Melainabacteria bacterium]
MKFKSKALNILTSNIDTDQIIPARHLTGISKTGLGVYLFEDLPNNPLDAIEHDDCQIIITLENFGCGSSREHAVWSITDRGFNAVVAASFARIFEENCYNNALVPVVLTIQEIEEISNFKGEIEIDVDAQILKTDKEYKFELDSLKKEFILKGGFMKFLDAKVPEIKAWEATKV